jgi:hypothetical protein
MQSRHLQLCHWTSSCIFGCVIIAYLRIASVSFHLGYFPTKKEHYVFTDMSGIVVGSTSPLVQRVHGTRWPDRKADHVLYYMRYRTMRCEDLHGMVLIHRDNFTSYFNLPLHFSLNSQGHSRYSYGVHSASTGDVTELDLIRSLIQ